MYIPSLSHAYNLSYDLLTSLQRLQHLSRRTQTLTISIDGGNQTSIDLREFPLQNLHVCIILVLPSCCLIALHDLNLVRPILTGGQRDVGGSPPGWETWWSFISFGVVGLGRWLLLIG